MKVLSYHRSTSNQVAEEDLVTRVAVLEHADKKTANALFNFSREVAGLDKLHGSMLELLESVETIENKVDRSVPDLQREISKMEFNVAQMTSSVAMLKEDQVRSDYMYIKFVD